MSKVFKHAKGFSLVAVSVGLVLALLLGPVIPAKAAEEKTVKIGLQLYVTGPIATVGVPGSYGVFDYLRYINERGGINGTQVDYIWENLGGAPYGAITTSYKRFREDAEVKLFYCQSSAIDVVLPWCARDKFPMLAITGLGSPVWPPDMKPGDEHWVLGMSAGMENETATFIRWLNDNWKEERPLRIGVFTYDAAQGWGVKTGAEWACKQLGVDLVHTEIVGYMTLLDTSVEWLRMAAQEPDWVLTLHYGSNAAVIVKDVARLEIPQKGIKLAMAIGGLDEAVVAMVGDDAEGWYQYAWPPSNTDIEYPLMNTIFEVSERYRGWRPEDVKLFYTVGWLGAAVMVEGLRLAIEKVGLENLTRVAARDGLISIRDFDLGLPFAISLSQESPGAVKYIRVYQVEDGRNVACSDWIKAWHIAGEVEDPFW